MIKNKNKKKVHVSKFVSAGLIAGVVTCCPFVLANTLVQRSISDLQGTTWIFNDDLLFPDDLSVEGKIVFDVSFVSADVSYNTMVLWYDYFGYVGYQLSYVDFSESDNIVYDSVNAVFWTSDDYREVSFSGGTDLTNSVLIDFMEQNAVLQPGSSSNLDLYDQIYQLLSDFLFGGQVNQDDMTYKALVLTAGSTILSVFMIAIPFMAVFAFIRLFF